VYDASALVAYAHGQIAAAELISEINAEGRHVGVPSTCLAMALAALTDEWDITQLVRLMGTRTMVILPLGAEEPAEGEDATDELRQVGEFTRLADGDLNVGHAVAAALAHRAFYVTDNPKPAEIALPPSWPVIDLSPVRLVSDRFGLAVAPAGAVEPAEPEDLPDGPVDMPTVLEPMLATLGSLPTDGDWGYEFKWDGVRAVAYVDGDDLRVVTRNKVDVTHTYPEIDAVRAALAGHRAVLDGEIVALGRTGCRASPPFSSACGRPCRLLRRYGRGRSGSMSSICCTWTAPTSRRCRTPSAGKPCSDWKSPEIRWTRLHTGPETPGRPCWTPLRSSAWRG
jgi:hypothetical protein